MRNSMLIVDDIDMNIAILKSYFGEDYEVFCAYDGSAALEILNERKIDIVITDIFMPVMDGIELIKNIRKCEKLQNICIIAITDRGEEYEVKALKAGADDFINKPFRKELICHRIDVALSRDNFYKNLNKYHFCFNQNDIPFATVHIVTDNDKKPAIQFQYINNSFAKLANRSQEYFVGSRYFKFENMKGLVEFLQKVNREDCSEKRLFTDDKTGKYYDITAYKETENICSVIVMENKYAQVEKYERNRYVDQIKNLLRENPNTIGIIHINFTKDICDTYIGSTKYFDIMQENVNSEKLFEDLCKYIGRDSDREAFKKVFNREKLVKEFYEGVTRRQLDLLVHKIDKRFGWVRAYMIIDENIVTKDIEAIFYCIDINEIKTSQEIIDKVINTSYDTLICIDFTDDAARLLSSDGINYWGEKRTVSEMNEEIINYLEENYAGEDKEKFISDNNLYKIVEKMKNEKVVSADFKVKKPDGGTALKRGTFYWLDELKETMCFTRIDITDAFMREQERTKELENALKTAKELEKVKQELWITQLNEAQAASKAKTDFLARMSHDLRTPLNAIIGFSSNEIVNDSDEANKLAYFSKINYSSKYLLGLINDLLDMSKIESGKIELIKKNERVLSIIEDINAIVAPAAANKQIHYSYEVTGEPIDYIKIDKKRVEQIFINLLNNAIKFTEAGGRVFWKIQHLKIEDGKLFDKVIIEDNGIGMSEEFIKCAFEPFTQEQKAFSDGSGVGLGLSIVKDIVNKMGGTINVESTPGKGTRFIVELEFEVVEESDKDTFIEKCDYTILAGKKVLLCEDNSLNRQIAGMILSKRDLNVEYAVNGLEAVRMFEASAIEEYDAILMDIRMPEMNGLEAAKAIRNSEREDSYSVPIIAMTANAYAEDVKASFEAGMNEHLAKPIEPDVLYKTLYKFMS